MSKIDEMLMFLPTFWMKDEGSNNYKFLKSFAQTIDELSSNIDGLDDSIFLRTTTGEYLDDFAKLFKMIRLKGESDSDFRIRIQNFWQSVSRGGLVVNLVNLLADLLRISIDQITYSESEYGVFKMNANLGTLGGIVDLPTVEYVRTEMNKIKAAGVYVQLLFSPLILEFYDGSYVEDISIDLGVEGIVGDYYFFDGVGELI